jgi:hypothetical protein
MERAARDSAGAPPDTPAGRLPSGHSRRKRPVLRWVVNGVLLAALAVGLFAFLPRLGGFAHDAAALRHARPAFAAAAIVAQAASLSVPDC